LTCVFDESDNLPFCVRRGIKTCTEVTCIALTDYLSAAMFQSKLQVFARTRAFGAYGIFIARQREIKCAAYQGIELEEGEVKA
jgi:hypothetical protein